MELPAGLLLRGIVSVPYTTQAGCVKPTETGGDVPPLVVVATHTDDAVLVYQAFNDEIADYAVAHGKFDGCPAYKARMTWVKPNLSWMLFRCDWTRRDINQRRVLGLWLDRGFFETLVQRAAPKGGDLRIQWDPAHHILPPYAKQPHRHIQLGLRGPWQEEIASGRMVKQIVDMTPFLTAQLPAVEAGDVDSIQVPAETPMHGLVSCVDPSEVRRHGHKPTAAGDDAAPGGGGGGGGGGGAAAAVAAVAADSGAGVGATVKEPAATTDTK